MSNTSPTTFCKNNKRVFLFFFVLLSVIFLLLRLYNLPNTVRLFGDTARDLLVLEHWYETGKPPLLGPHTSALSFNQSAWYFYLLYPFYLFSAGSLYTANWAIIVYYLSFFGLGAWLVSKKRFNAKVFLILLSLITFHPELIKQTRDVWNPSLVLPAVILATATLLKLKTQIKAYWLLFLSFLLFFVLGASYSLAPFFLTFFLTTSAFIFKQKNLIFKKRIKYFLILILFAILSFVLINLGTIAYELRHGFLLTKNIGNQQVLQTSHELSTKAFDLGKLILSTNQSTPVIAIAVFVIASLIFSLLPQYRHRFHTNFVLIASLLVVNILLLIFLPFQIHPHYIFGILGLFFVYICLLPSLPRWLLLGFLLINWAVPILKGEYFVSVHPTAEARERCLKKVFSQYQDLLYVVTNSPSHDHQALGYEYLGKKLDLPVISILNFPGNNPKFMAVFNENSNFDFDQTDFYELSQFGERQLAQEITCSDRLTVTIFSSI